MSRLRKFLALPFSQRCLLLEAAFWLCAVRIFSGCLPFSALRRWIDRMNSGIPSAQPDPRRTPQIIRAVEAAGRRLPGAGNCLVQALAAQILLRRRGKVSFLRIGVAHEKPNPFEAHAWLEGPEGVLIGGAQAVRYTPLPYPERL